MNYNADEESYRLVCIDGPLVAALASKESQHQAQTEAVLGKPMLVPPCYKHYLPPASLSTFRYRVNLKLCHLECSPTSNEISDIGLCADRRITLVEFKDFLWGAQSSADKKAERKISKGLQNFGVAINEMIYTEDTDGILNTAKVSQNQYHSLRASKYVQPGTTL